jgi:hypothetical protein
MSSWPTTLPNINLAGYSLSPVDQTIRTEMESSTSRARRRTSARNDRLSVSWVMTDAEFATFRTWFDADSSTGAAGGAAWFTIKAGIGEGGLTTLEARFIGPFTATGLGALLWDVSGNLEVR